MGEKENKPANRYSLILEIISPSGEVTTYNYYEFLKQFNAEMPGVWAKMPLASVDKFTTQYENEEQFNIVHRDFFSDNYPRAQFVLLTNLNPEDCRFSLHIEYKPNYKTNESAKEKYYSLPYIDHTSNYQDSDDVPEIKCLDCIFGDNNYLKEFLKSNSAKAEYNWNNIMYLIWQFYKQLENDEFYSFTVDRISGFEKHNRFTDTDSRLLEQIKYCHDAFGEGKKYEVTKLTKLQRYKSLRAMTMIMTEFEKRQKEYEAERYSNITDRWFKM